MRQEGVGFFWEGGVVYNLTSRSSSLTKIISDIFLIFILCNQAGLNISNNEDIATFIIKSYKSRWATVV